MYILFLGAFYVIIVHIKGGDMMEDDLGVMKNKTAADYWEEADFTDNLIFRMVMEKESLVKELLEILLNMSISFIQVRQHEKSFEADIRARGIRLDVYIKDSNGTVYDIEMQTGVYKAEYFGKRTRYYQSVIDYELLKKNKPYTDLSHTIIIFICTFDPFGKNLGKYTFKNICKENKDVYLGDESEKIFFNAKGMQDNLTNEQKAFLNFVAGKGATDRFTKNLEAQVKYVKSDSKKKVEYMTWKQELIEQKNEGILEANKNMVVKLLKRGKMTLQEIAEDCAMSVEQIREIAKANKIAI